MNKELVFMPTNEYMTPEIGKIIPMLSQTCDELTRQALIRGITQKTQEWVEGDPELADILLEGKKTLEECVRYVTEKAACVISKNINSMLNSEIENLPKMKIQGRDATMAGGAIDAEQVYKWAEEYYYTPDAKPTDFKAEAKRKADETKRAAERKKTDDAKKTAGKKNPSKAPNPKSKARGSAEPVPSCETAKDPDAKSGMEQMSIFASPPADDVAA